MLSRQWRNADRRCLSYIWVINNFIAYWGATYIRGLTVHFIKYILDCISLYMIKGQACITEMTRSYSKPGQKGRHSAGDILKCILLKENIYILIQIPLQFVRKNKINNNSALIQAMTCPRFGVKPIPEIMMAYLSLKFALRVTSFSKTCSCSHSQSSTAICRSNCVLSPLPMEMHLCTNIQELSVYLPGTHKP